MLSILSIKIPEGMVAEIETLVHDLGLWENRSEFIREAIDQQIKKYWNGGRFEH
jgi:Arc/MetJ-type ribon-helix-helix transcriptional regulator